MYKLRAFFLATILLTTLAFAQPQKAAKPDFFGMKARISHDVETTTGKVAVVVMLQDDSVVKSYSAAMQGKTANQAAAVSAAQSQAARIELAQQDFLSRLGAQKVDARVLYRLKNVYNGVALVTDAANMSRLRAMTGVKSVSILRPKTPDLFYSVPLQGIPVAWSAPTSVTGTGIRIGIIDTGVDYAHANFGGNESYLNDTTIIGDHADFPDSKVVGGYDFAGDSYNASDPLNDVPNPDPDPMDCNGHGSHVAGIAAGLGVTTAGTTYPGPYDATTHSSPLRIGPGVAPGAEIYALRVFGCVGSTNLTDQAIDWAVDPNGDFDPSDHLDVINMSLGSSFGSPDDSSTIAAEAAAQAGVIVVASAGNSGDIFYISGSPGASQTTITVANSVDGYSVIGGLIVNAPPAIAGNKAATDAVFGPDLAVIGDVTGNVVLVNDGVGTTSDGCQAIVNAGAVAGNIALIDRGICTFKTKVLNAQNAGAIGVIIGNNQAGFPITMGNDATIVTPITIPSQMIGLTDTTAMKAQLGVGVNATLTASLRNQIESIDPTINDTLASSSSRGPRRAGSFLKPDITAVGDSVFSTLSGSGDQGLNIGGTSMAAPHIAGAAALMRQLHPTWTVEEIKALLMNTATQDLFTGINHTGTRYGAGRTGAGRLSVNVAVGPDAAVVAYNENDNGAVSVGFGFIDVVDTGAGTDFTTTKQVTIRNFTANAVSYNLSTSLSNTGTNIPGVSFSVAPSSITVPGNGVSLPFNVWVDIDASQMRHTRDSSVANAQATNYGTFARDWISEEAGYVVLTPTAGGAPTIRIPVYVVARAASSMTTVEANMHFTAPTGTATLTPSGTPVFQFLGTTSDDYSLVSAFLLQENSPYLGLGTTADNADLQSIGVANDLGRLTFGLATYGPWSTLNEVTFRVFIDVDKDGNDDYFVQNTNIGTAGAGSTTDQPVSVICPISAASYLDCELGYFVNLYTSAANGINPQTFNNNVVTLSLDATQIGDPGSFNYTVVTYSRDWDGIVDVSDTHSYDYNNPGLTVSTASLDGFLNFDDPAHFGGPIGFDYDTLAYQNNSGLGVLLLHHHNQLGSRVQVLPVVLDSDLTVTKTDNPDPIWLGNDVTYTVTVTNNGPAIATNVSLVDTLDGNSSFVATSDPGNCNQVAGVVTCNAGTLAVGETYTVYITATVNNGPSLTNTASATSDNNDPNPADNTAIPATTTVNDSGTNSSLSVTKTDNPDPVFNGTNLEYTITVTNNGPDPAQSVVVTDYLPVTTNFVDVTPSQGFCTTAPGIVTCNVGTLASGDTVTVVINVTPTVGNITITNIASANAQSNLSGTTSDAEDTFVNLNAELAITKTEDADPHAPGDTVTYTIDVVNNGPDDAFDLTMNDTLPALAQFQSVTPPAGWTCTDPGVGNTGLVQCTIATLAAGGTAQFTIDVIAPISAGYKNVATIEAASPGDSDLSNNTSTTYTSVLLAAAATPTACTATETLYSNETPTPVNSYATVTSTITVANADPYVWDVDLVTWLDESTPDGLRITITSPSGREVTVSNHRTCCFSTFSNTAWDDQANNPVTDLDFFSNPSTPLTVEEALGAFRGEDPNGDWTIAIEETYGGSGTLEAWSLRLTTLSTVPNELTRSYANNNTIQVPRLGQLTSTINVSGSGPIANLDVITNIFHIASDELILQLTSPQGTTVTLSSFNGNLHTFEGTLWDDNAGDTNPPGAVTENVLPFSLVATPLVPESALAAFNGEDPNGDWTLTITDTNLNLLELLDEFQGRLNNWSLNIGTASCGNSDIAITKVDDPDPVQTGDSLHYTLTVTNNGPDDATGVQVTDPLPNGVVFVSAYSGCTNASGTVTCNIGALANGASATIDLYVQPTLPGLITNTACAYAFEADAAGGNNCATATTQVQLNAPIHTDLSIDKTDSADPTTVGSNLAYTLTVTNLGPDDSDGFTVTDTLPAEVTFVSASSGCSFSAGTVTCVYPGPLADGASAAFTINVSALSTANPASNTACVAANNVDTDPANDCDTETTVINPGPTANSDLAIDKVDNPDPVQVFDSLHYTLTVTNNGPDPATNIVVTDTLHPSVTFVTASAACVNNSGVITCTAAGPVAAAGTVVFDIYVVPTLAGPIPNTACVAGFVNDANSANNCDNETTTVTLSAPGFTDLQLIKSDNADPVISTSAFSYLLTVTNQGPDASQGFTITDTLPADVVFSSASAGCVHDGSPTGGVVTCVFNGDLANGASTSLMVNVTAGNVLSQTIATNTACVVADNSDTVSSNNCDSEDTTIDPVPPTSNADLSIVKTDSFDPLQVGSLLTYTLSVTNIGPDTATQIHVTDPLHPSTTFLSASAGCLHDVNTHTVTCDIASLPSGGNVQFQIQVGTTLAGTVTNTACVQADFNNDAVPANNCDSENTTITITPPILTDLSLTKTASASSVLAGNNITYTLVVFNDGPDVSTGHTVSDTLPAEVKFVSASAGCVHDGSPAGGVVTCQFGPLGNNASTTYTIVAQAIAAPQAVNNACVAADNFDLGGANDCASATTAIVPTSVDLSLIKNGSPSTATVNANVDYTITITNNGPDPSTGSTVVDTLPGEVQFVSASPGCVHVAGTVTCSIGALTLGNTTSVTIRVQVVATGTLLNTATVTGNDLDPNSANNTDTETTIANQCLFCDDFEDSVIQPEGVWTYTPDITHWSEDGDNLVGQATGKVLAVASPIFAGCQVCTVQTQMSTSGGLGNVIWFLSWFVDTKNTVELLMKQEKGKWILKQRVNNTVVKKASFKQTINVGQFYDVKITFNGSAFIADIGGTTSAITMVPAAPVPVGTIGYRVKATTGRIAFINVN